jgi:hypothetical protein
MTLEIELLSRRPIEGLERRWIRKEVLTISRSILLWTSTDTALLPEGFEAMENGWWRFDEEEGIEVRKK